MPFLFFFFFLFFYIMFLLISRYKMLSAALAMETTKPILEKQKTKETIKLSLLHYIGAQANCLPKPYNLVLT